MIDNYNFNIVILEWLSYTHVIVIFAYLFYIWSTVTLKLSWTTVPLIVIYFHYTAMFGVLL